MIPNTITSIGSYAFAGSRLSTLTIPNSVLEIKNNAFGACTSLTSIVLPSSITKIDSQTFYNCTNLASISISDNILSIGERAFYNCDGLTSITIPSSVTDIGRNPFESCTNLTSIKVQSGNTVYDSRNDCNAIIRTVDNTLISGCATTMIPNTITSIGSFAFAGSRLSTLTIPNSVLEIKNNAFGACTSLTSIVLPSSITKIDSQTFYNCTSLASISIPNNTLSIGERAFYNCWKLNRITIPSSVTRIDTRAFEACSGISDLYCHSTTPPSCTNDCFSYYTATLHVPSASLAAYFIAPCWKNFENIVGDAVAPTGISLNKDSVNLQLDEQLTLVATVTPDNASNKEITWISTDTTVATVNDGVVLAVGYGECDIIASCFGMRAICHVLVANIITLDQQEAMLLPNHLLTLTPSAPTTPDSYAVSSSDPTVAAARVLSSGKIQVVGIKEGTTTITVGSVDGTAIPATCLVTVYTETGDMNSDGFVNISDVTSLINYLLSGDDSQISTKNADVNGDNKISISDVTALINILLSDNG